MPNLDFEFQGLGLKRIVSSLALAGGQEEAQPAWFPWFKSYIMIMSNIGWFTDAYRAS